MYRCKYFSIFELIPKEMYEARLLKLNIPRNEWYNKKTYKQLEKENVFWREWLLFDDRLLKIADKVREKYGKMSANNYAWGGIFSGCGFRNELGTSQHTKGRALDLTPLENSLAIIQEDILSDRKKWKYIKGIEIGKTVTWLHIDTRNSDHIMVFDIPN